MHFRATMTLCCVVVACGGAGSQGPLERLASATREDLCAGLLVDITRTVRESRSEDELPAVLDAIRWAAAHPDLECNPVVGARRLWRDAIFALERIGTERAQQGLVESIAASHRPGSVHDRRNATRRPETAAAFQALSRGAPVSPPALDALLDWFDLGAVDCSVDEHRGQIVRLLLSAAPEGTATLSRRFPPPAGSGRCAAAMLLVDVFAEASARQRSDILEASLGGADADRWIADAVSALGGSVGPFAEAVAARACQLAVERAEAAFDRSAADPERATDEALALCGDAALTSEGLVRIQRRLTGWMVERGRAEDALLILEGLPDGMVEDSWRLEVGVALVFARLERGRLLPASEALEELSSRLGATHADLQPVRGVVRRALEAATRQALEAEALPDVSLLSRTIARLFGETAETRRIGLELRLAEAATAAGSRRCLPEAELERLQADLEAARAGLVADGAEDAAARAMFESTWRAWRAMRRRCGR